MTVSVIISVYNAEDDLDTGISSVLNSSFRDIELILVDDGSTDGSAGVCRAAAERDDRVRFIKLERNMGQGAARNVGLSAATGDFIMFCDADDWIEQNAVERLLSAAENGCDIVICGYNIDVADKKGNVVSRAVQASPAVMTTRAEMLSHFVELKYTYLLDAACNKLYRTAFLREHALKMPEGEIYEDTQFALDAIMNTDRVTVIPDLLYHYNQRDGSTTKRFKKDMLKYLKIRHASILRYLGEDGLKDRSLSGFAAMFYIMSVFSYFADLFLKGSSYKKAEIKSLIAAEQAEDGFSAAIREAVAANRGGRVTLAVARRKSVFLSYMYSKAVCFIKYKARLLFLKLK